MRDCLVKYSEAAPLIQECDLLAFRGQGLISWVIQIWGRGKYSHTALCSWSHDEKGAKVDLEVIEYKEWVGSRVSSLKNYVNQNPGIIDVFRPVEQFEVYNFNCKQRTLEKSTKYFVGKRITNHFRKLTGLPYGYQRILYLARQNLPFLRFFPDKNTLDDNAAIDIFPVCSTIISTLFSLHYVDPVKFRSNSSTEPNDLTRSPLFQYMFTLMPD